MKFKYGDDRPKRKTIPIRIQKDQYDALLAYAQKRGHTRSKTLDALYDYGIGFLKLEDDFHIQYPEIFSNDLVRAKLLTELREYLKKQAELGIQASNGPTQTLEDSPPNHLQESQ